MIAKNLPTKLVIFHTVFDFHFSFTFPRINSGLEKVNRFIARLAGRRVVSEHSLAVSDFKVNLFYFSYSV